MPEEDHAVPPHMSADDFRRHAHALADFIADYHERIVREAPVLSAVAPGEVMGQLPSHAPESGESWDDILGDVGDRILPALTHWQSPNFFGYFPANASYPAMLAEFLCAGLGVQGMLWQTSPACTELEQRVLDWLAHAIGLPEAFTFRPEASGPASGGSGGTSGGSRGGGTSGQSSGGGGVIQGTASEATLVAMVSARARARGQLGDDARLIAYTSEQAHSSVMKAAMIAGIGRDNLRLIPTDSALAMDPDALRSRIEADLRSGLRPFFLCATLGTTSTGAFDPVDALGSIAQEHAMWHHIDAAWAGSAAICPEHRGWMCGVERADSFCFNPHKWLLTNFDCSAYWTRDRAALLDALSITPEYLRNQASDAGAVVDYRDWQIPLGRRFRAIKLWFVMRHYGLEGLRAHIRRHIALAEQFERWVRADDRFEIAQPRSLSLVTFRLRADDDANRRLLNALNDTGKLFLTHTVVPTIASPQTPRFVLRLAIGSTHTAHEHVERAWECIRAETDRIQR
ncbi:MAG: aspartate aminotransferase family protein [Phycisphaeraceae bacterium]|nr:MAG: aspartate aminotransferase family protein [Phycisphaeraceae bacterium]